MYKIFRIFLFSIFIQNFLITVVLADSCFVAKENGKVVKQIGKCDQRHSPFSTFKIPLALMGFDSKILNSTASPKIEYTTEIEKKYVTYYNPQRYPIMFFWKRAQTPQSWMRESVMVF